VSSLDPELQAVTVRSAADIPQGAIIAALRDAGVEARLLAGAPDLRLGVVGPDAAAAARAVGRALERVGGPFVPDRLAPDLFFLRPPTA